VERRQERLAKGRSATFKNCAEQLIEARKAGWKNEKHRAQWESSLRTYVYPHIGSMPVASIDTEAVLRCLQPFWKIKTESASRVRGRIEAVLSWAKVRGLRSGENPAAWRGHLDQLLPRRSKVQTVQHHPALPYRAVPDFMMKLRARKSMSARALEFTILTAARTREAIGARFAEFDLSNALWCIPAERMKAGQEHRVPLCERAVEIVRDMKTNQLHEFVFAGSRANQPLSNMAMLMLLRKLVPGVTVHGFRSSFRDWAGEETSHAYDVCEAALAHRCKDKTQAAYQRGDRLQKRRKLMAEWSGYCGSRILRHPAQLADFHSFHVSPTTG
jgi:integrase